MLLIGATLISSVVFYKDIIGFINALISSSPVDKDKATTFFFAEVLIAWAVIWKIQPRKKLAGYILWMGILILGLGLGADVSWFSANSMKFAGITMVAVSSYYIYLAPTS